MIGFEVEVKWFRLLWSQGTSQRRLPIREPPWKEIQQVHVIFDGCRLTESQDATLQHHVCQSCSTPELFVERNGPMLNMRERIYNVSTVPFFVSVFALLIFSL